MTTDPGRSPAGTTLSKVRSGAIRELHGGGTPCTARPATVLIAEDDAFVRRLAARILTGGGYRARTARDGREALDEIARHGDVDLVVSDVVMPSMNGLELTARLVDQQIPVLLISSYSPSDLGFPGKAGWLSYLPKPFTPAELLGEVTALLQPQPV